MKVKNIINARGNAVANQFIIENSKYIGIGEIGNDEPLHTKDYYFQSYKSICAMLNEVNGKKYCLTLGKDWDYSNTTMRHLYNFFDAVGVPLHNSKEVRKAINNGFIGELVVVYDECMQ